MKRIRSKKLWEYLNDAEVLNGSPEEISVAKKEYRKAYRREWMKTRASLTKEVRIEFTRREYHNLLVYANTIGISPTALCKTLTSSAIQNKQIIPNKEKLQDILQMISMTFNMALKLNAPVQLIKELHSIESMLLEYLNTNAM